jgi:superfamily II DNA or RNA helicase
MRIKIKILNASYAQTYKNYENDLWMKNILSFPIVYMQNGILVRKNSSAFKYNKFGLGLISYIKEELKKVNKEYEVEISFEFKPLPIKKTKDIKLNNKEFEDYQIETLNLLDNKIKRGIISSATASGKTTISAGIIDKFNRPNTLIITPTTDIARNTVESLSNDLQTHIGLIGDSEFEIQQITVILYQSLRNIIKNKPDILKNLINKTQLIILDEIHLAPKAIEECLSLFVNTFYRFGMSATPKTIKNKKEYLQITGQVGPIITTIDDKQAEKRVITNIKCIMWEFKHDPKYKEYQLMYRYDVLLNPQRCILLCKMAEYSFKIEKRFNCLLLVDELKQAELIKSYSNSFKIPEPIIVSSQLNTTEVEKIKKDLNGGEIQFVIATTKFSVGTDIPEIETIILGSARKSIDNTIQKIGRGKRKTEGKKDLLLLDIYDIIGERDKFFKKYSKIRMKYYKEKGWIKGIFKWKK